MNEKNGGDIMEEVKFIADKVLLRGPRVDGTYIVSLEVGEYEKVSLAKLLFKGPLVEVTVKDVKN